LTVPAQRCSSSSDCRIQEALGLVNGSFSLPPAAQPLIVAHRGASRVAPANTLSAFLKAAELGADGVELDVHLSADGVPVVIHDDTVDATTDGSGWVADMSVAQLKQLDAGSWFDRAFAGERIPTLEEVFQAVGDRLLVNVELKSSPSGRRGLERAVVALVERYGLAERVWLSSFSLAALRRARRLAPHMRLGLLYGPGMPRALQRLWLRLVGRYAAYHPEHGLVDAPLVAWARRRGSQVHAWTVNDPSEMRRLVGLGVDGIITDLPDVLQGILGERPRLS
jgi:glycerophosphoryl diester phosphodiesterase